MTSRTVFLLLDNAGQRWLGVECPLYLCSVFNFSRGPRNNKGAEKAAESLPWAAAGLQDEAEQSAGIIELQCLCSAASNRLQGKLQVGTRVSSSRPVIHTYNEDLPACDLGILQYKRP